MEIVLYIGIVQSFFAFLLMLFKKNGKNSDIVMAVWLLFISMQLISNLIGIRYAEYLVPALLIFKLIPFTYGPFVYIYAKLLVLEKPVFRIRYIFHFIPFVLSLLFFFIFLSKEEIITEVKASFLGGDLSVYHLSSSIIMILLIDFYVIQVWRLIKQHEKKVYEHFSFDSYKTNLRWLKTIAILFSSAFTLSIIARIFNFYFDSNNPLFEPFIFPALGLTFFAYALSFFGFNQEAVFVSTSFLRLQRRQDRLKLANEEEKLQNTHTKYERSGLKEDDARAYLKQLTLYMEEAKPYLDGNLTIEVLARDLNIPKHHLTQIINEKTGKNFYNFVNEYRVKEVIQQMKDDKEQKLTLLALAFDSGFNSKSSFNTIFKKFTGKTPSQFRTNLEKSTN